MERSNEADIVMATAPPRSPAKNGSASTNSNLELLIEIACPIVGLPALPWNQLILCPLVEGILHLIDGAHSTTKQRRCMTGMQRGREGTARAIHEVKTMAIIQSAGTVTHEYISSVNDQRQYEQYMEIVDVTLSRSGATRLPAKRRVQGEPTQCCTIELACFRVSFKMVASLRRVCGHWDGCYETSAQSPTACVRKGDGSEHVSFFALKIATI
eukprot:IDg7555t1